MLMLTTTTAQAMHGATMDVPWAGLGAAGGAIMVATACIVTLYSKVFAPEMQARREFRAKSEAHEKAILELRIREADCYGSAMKSVEKTARVCADALSVHARVAPHMERIAELLEKDRNNTAARR